MHVQRQRLETEGGDKASGGADRGCRQRLETEARDRHRRQRAETEAGDRGEGLSVRVRGEGLGVTCSARRALSASFASSWVWSGVTWRVREGVGVR